MRSAFWGRIFVFLLTVFSAFCYGQCTNGFQQQTFNCRYSDQCYSQITVNIPNGGKDGVVVASTGVSCCGQLFTTCYGTGNCEDVKRLKDPVVRERLISLARTSGVLVADCKGQYVLFSPSTDALPKRPRLALLEDRILR